MGSDIIMELTFAILIVFSAVLFIAIVFWIVGILQKSFCVIKHINTKRKKLIILWSGTIIIVIMCFFPPFISNSKIKGDYRMPDKYKTRYTFLFSNEIPIRERMNYEDYDDYRRNAFVPAHIDFVRLIIQCAIVGLITGVLLFTLGNSKSATSIQLGKQIDKSIPESKQVNINESQIDDNAFVKGLNILKIGDAVEKVLSLIGNPTIIQRDKDGSVKWIYEKAKKGTLFSTIYSYVIVISNNKIIEIIQDSD